MKRELKVEDESFDVDKIDGSIDIISTRTLRRSARVKTKMMSDASLKTECDVKPEHASVISNCKFVALNGHPKTRSAIKKASDDKSATPAFEVKIEKVDIEQHCIRDEEVGVEQAGVPLPPTSPPQQSGFPASQQDGLLLLPFVYTLQILQRGSKNGLVSLAKVLTETTKLKPDFVDQCQSNSVASFLEYAHKHLDIIVTATPEGATCIKFRDVNLPWLTQLRTSEMTQQAMEVHYSQSWSSLHESGILALVEILYCCSKMMLDFRALWIYLDEYGKIIFQT